MSDSPPSAIDEAHEAIARCMAAIHDSPADTTSLVDALNLRLTAIVEAHGITLDELAARLHAENEAE